MTDLVGERIRICHKRGRIKEENDRSYVVLVDELGGLMEQRIVVTKEYAEEHVIEDHD